MVEKKITEQPAEERRTEPEVSEAETQAQAAADTDAARDASAQAAQDASPDSSKTERAQTVADETGVIASGTKITGDIVTKGHLVIYGEVEGNITANGDIVAAGRITGDISCNNLRTSGCSGKANLNARGSVTIDTGSRIEGKIVCHALSVDGTVQGDIEAAAEVSIFRNGKINGNIQAKTLGVEPGAQLAGSIMVTAK